MKFLAVFAIVVSVAAAAEIFRAKPEWDDQWKDFKGKHGKQYKNAAEEALRRKNWETARTKINKHNEEAAAGVHSYTMADNFLSDYNAEELQALTRAQPPVSLRSQETDGSDGSDEDVIAEDRQTTPTSVDYRNASCMPAVKNQGQCGSCWSFAANTPLEFALCRKNLKSYILSEQQLVDCSRSYGNLGCNGGWYGNAWKYVMAAPGQASSAVYPYTALNGTCKYVATQSIGKPVGIVNIAKKNETLIRQAVATRGPVSAALQVVSSFNYYSSGIYSETNCPTDGQTVNHAVVIAGYGTLNGVNYWIIRNSWGAYWGQKGYILMKRGINQCNIESYAAYPTV